LLFNVWNQDNILVKVINIIAKDHNRWITIAKSFGLKDDAEDLVQDMYIKINQWKGKYDKTLMFNDKEVNQYFVFKVLRNLFLDKVKKQKKIIKLSDTFYEPSISAMSMEYQERLDFVKSEIDTWSLYHKKIYELVFLEGKSIQWLSDKTGIEYHTVRRAVQKIKKNINLKLKQK
jgi:RNA polymerase sigma factor (sigma-70 family)